MVRFVIWEPWRTTPWGAMNKATILKTQVCHYQEKGEERAKGWAGQSSDVRSQSGAGGRGRQQSKLGKKSRQPRASDRSVHREEGLWPAVGHGVSLFNHFGREPLPVRMRNRSVCFFPVAEMDTPAQGAYGGSKGLLTHGSKKVTSGKARCS